MHPDEAVQIAIQDLRTPGLHAPPPAVRAPGRSIAAALLHAYSGALRWYVQDGRTSVADGGTAVGHLPRMRLGVDAAADADLVPLGVEVAR